MADNDNAIVNSGASGAAAGGSVGGPWGAVIGGAGGVLAGLINSQNGQPSPDLSGIFATIAQSGQNEQQLINQLPASLQPLYAQYKASLGAAGTTLQNTTNQTGQNLLNQTTANYSPTSPAVTATLQALKQQDYSTLPGTLTNLKSQLAASGGLDRGGATKAITQAVLNPATQFSQQAATTTGQQLQSQQQNVQAALNKIAAMDDATANSLFGMSTAQAQQILTSGRQDLQTQLSQLINQSNIQTTQQLNAEGIQSNAGYQNQVASNAGQAAIVNGLVNTGAQGLYSALAAPGTTPAAQPAQQALTANDVNGSPDILGYGTV